jgi:hypothetical protein
MMTARTAIATAPTSEATSSGVVGLINFGITLGTSSCLQIRPKVGQADWEARLHFSIGSSLSLFRLFKQSWI